MKTTDIKKWYKESYVWLLILFPSIAIAGGIFTFWLAYKTNDGLVVDDYYVKGLQINKDLRREKNAASYELTAKIEFDHSKQQLNILLTGNNRFTEPQIIEVTFVHSTRKGFDRSLLLTRDNDGVYRIGMPELVTGKWNVLIETDNWRKSETYMIK
jgi:uncharacterized protein